MFVKQLSKYTAQSENFRLKKNAKPEKANFVYEVYILLFCCIKNALEKFWNKG